MSINLQLLFTGLGIGSIYALVALGFVLIYRATNVVNFAQGDFSMIGAFLMVVFAIDMGLPYWLSAVIAIVAMAGFGILFNYGVYYPLRHRTFLPVSSARSALRSCFRTGCWRPTVRTRRAFLPCCRSQASMSAACSWTASTC